MWNERGSSCELKDKIVVISREARSKRRVHRRIDKNERGKGGSICGERSPNRRDSMDHRSIINNWDWGYVDQLRVWLEARRSREATHE